MKTVTIYCLCDPSTCKVRYIGRTTKKILSQRLAEHISKSKYFDKYFPGKKANHKVNWINSLLNQGKEPIIKKICQIQGWKESHDLERKIISNHCNKRNLTNSDDRGEGWVNKIISEEQKIEISKTLKIYYKTNENAKAKSVEVYFGSKYIGVYSSATKFAKEINTSVRSVTRVAAGEYGRKTVKGYSVKYISCPV